MSFFGGIENFFKKLFGSTNWEKTASTTLALIAPLTEEIVAEAAGEPAEAEVQSIVTQAQSDLALVSGIVSDAKGVASPTLVQTAVDTLESVKSNLSGLLTAGHIKDPAKLSKISGITKTIIGEVEAILGAIPKPAAPSAPAAPVAPIA